MVKTNVDISEIDKLLKDLEKELKSCKGVQIGWLEEEKALNHKREQTQQKQGDIAIKLNFGNPEEKIPPRPFMTNSIRGKNKVYGARLKYLFDKEMPLGAALVQFGETIRKDIQDEIDSNTPPPNSPLTIELKGSSRTLIDTGHMRNSIQVQIMKANDE